MANRPKPSRLPTTEMQMRWLNENSIENQLLHLLTHRE